jgi:hypothetical protein
VERRLLLGRPARRLFLLDACAVAREVAEQSVVLAGVGAALGAALALGGLRKTKPQQVMLATHAASVIALANGLRRAHALVREGQPRRSPTRPPGTASTIQAVLERLSSADDGLPAARRRPAPPPRPRRASRPPPARPPSARSCATR